MTTVALILAGLAAALHVFIFYLESFAWTTKALSVFGLTAEEAARTKEMAFNQGFYNLFLAIIAFVGIACWSTGFGPALVVAGVGSMLAAAVLLFATSPPTSAPRPSNRARCRYSRSSRCSSSSAPAAATASPGNSQTLPANRQVDFMASPAPWPILNSCARESAP